MQHGRLLCLDIETVPDRSIMPEDWPPDRFPKPIWHKVAAISFVEARIVREGERERYETLCCRSGGEADWDEARLLRSFWRFFEAGSYRIVTWNGRSFDLPVLRLRAMMHGISAAAWFNRGDRWSGYASRYAPAWHCDVMDELADRGAAMRLGLEDAACAMGLPGKIGGHGADVAEMVERGDLAAVRAYCEADTLNLMGLYVRYALLTGLTDVVGHDASLGSLEEYLSREGRTRPHLAEFLDGWRASDRPAPGRIGPSSM